MWGSLGRKRPQEFHERDVRAELDAVTRVVQRLAEARDATEAVQAALDTVREEFGWAYASAWKITDGKLHCVQDSGSTTPAFRAATQEAAFQEGDGIPGRAWKTRALFFAPQLADIPGCTRAEAAKASGIHSGVSFPLTEGGEVVGTMDFLSADTLHPSEERMTALRCVGIAVSQAIERLSLPEKQREEARDIESVNKVIREVTMAHNRQESIAAALETIRLGFDWAYGSFWSIDPDINALTFVQESGEAGEEFRQVTREASFAHGVGLSGRTWKAQDLVFVPDLAEVHDCVRAPAARRAGVKSGVCLPIIMNGAVVGTMDFFTTKTLFLSPSREAALRNTAFLVGQALERHAEADRLKEAANQLLESVREVSVQVDRARTVSEEGQSLASAANLDVAALGASSAEIGDVVGDIQGIASQTNLLALNATIEAARAGNAGNAFAIVAREVKDLAGATASATTRVSTKVSTIQGQVEQVVEALGRIGDVIEQVGATQREIESVLSEQSQTTRAILG